MESNRQYQGIFPAFYACYESDGEVSRERTQKLARHLVDKGIHGLYVGGSSGECIYQSVSERKRILEWVMEAVQRRIPVIAHVACNNTRDSMELAAHAQGLGVNAIAAIPPIYFHLPQEAIGQYWNDISSAAPQTDFFIYNIPQFAGVALTADLYRAMLDNPRVAGVKNSSMAAQDIQIFKALGGPGRVVMNGPDEQLVSGLAMGADGGIGGTYGVMPELYLRIKACVDSGDLAQARRVQNLACGVIAAMTACRGNLYAVMKEILRRREGIDIGSVRAPLPPVTAGDDGAIAAAVRLLDQAMDSIL